MEDKIEITSKPAPQPNKDLAEMKDYSERTLEGLDLLLHQTQVLNIGFDGIQKDPTPKTTTNGIGKFLGDAAGHTGRVNTGSGFAALGKRIGTLHLLQDNPDLRRVLGLENMWQSNTDKLKVFFREMDGLTQRVLSVEDEVISHAHNLIEKSQSEPGERDDIRNAISNLGAAVCNILRELSKDDDNKDLADQIEYDSQDVVIYFMEGTNPEETKPDALEALHRLKTEYSKAKDILIVKEEVPTL